MYNNTARKNKINNNKTRKIKAISGKIISKKDGWINAEIRGSPFERGYAHGSLFYKELKLLKKLLPFIVKTEIERNFNEYITKSNQLIKPQLIKKFPEFYDEMRGIVSGSKSKGVNVSLDFIIAWNAYVSLDSYFNDGNCSEKCSAFIATGSATEKGDIIVTHNTHFDLMSARLFNINLYVIPDTGHTFVMQTAPGLIYSATDWFISDNGIVGMETTISKINYKPQFGAPIFCRIRQVMQYANSLDECVNSLLEDNAGDYASGWMFGDTRTGEIMLIELGLKKYDIQRTKNGVFFGINSPMNKELRESETDSKDFYDITTPIGNRRKRINFLLHKKYYGKINISNAKKILSDHYDYNLGYEKMSRKCICKHSEIDPTGDVPFKLSGAYDGKVVNSSMIDSLSFLARYGSSCGKRNFSKEKYLREHPEKEKYREFIEDLPVYPWSFIKNE